MPAAEIDLPLWRGAAVCGKGWEGFPAMKPLVLIESDDLELFLLLQHILDVDGFAARLAEDGEETLRLAIEGRPQAIVLNCREGQSCAETCARLKRAAATSAIPVVALVGAGAEKQHAGLVKAGADECLTRPFAPVRLLEYLRMAVGVWPGEGSQSVDAFAGHVRYGGIELRFDTFSVRCNGDETRLGPIEFRLLLHLLENPGQVFSRHELIGAAWPGDRIVEPRTVDVHIGRLRKMLKPLTGSSLIRTVRSEGYALEYGRGDTDR